jgi:hypothetical protein
MSSSSSSMREKSSSRGLPSPSSSSSLDVKNTVAAVEHWGGSPPPAGPSSHASAGIDITSAHIKFARPRNRRCT